MIAWGHQGHSTEVRVRAGGHLRLGVWSRQWRTVTGPHSATPAHSWLSTRSAMCGVRGQGGGGMQSCPKGAVSLVGGQRSGQYCARGLARGAAPWGLRRALTPRAGGRGDLRQKGLSVQEWEVRGLQRGRPARGRAAGPH